jgi:hypothetical protein
MVAEPMAVAGMNELTFAGWLAEFTAVWASGKEAAGTPTLIAAAAIEERQVDAKGAVRRCDVRFNSDKGRKLASGELKRPEVPEGRDVRAEGLRADARRKALARGLPYYFTCNIRHVALYEVAGTADQEDLEIDFLELGSDAPLMKFRVMLHQSAWLAEGRAFRARTSGV